MTSPEALIHLIEDFEAFKETGELLHDRLEEFSAAIGRTEPSGEAERVLLDCLKSLMDGAASRLGRVRGTTPSGGAAASIHLALSDLRKTPDFATAFAHIRRSKKLPGDFGDGETGAARNAYSVSPAKALTEPTDTER